MHEHLLVSLGQQPLIIFDFLLALVSYLVDLLLGFHLILGNLLVESCGQLVLSVRRDTELSLDATVEEATLVVLFKSFPNDVRLRLNDVQFLDDLIGVHLPEADAHIIVAFKLSVDGDLVRQSTVVALHV